jgi:hypothetical protein
LLGGFFLTASWILGYLSFFPLFASIRQIIEHRNPSNDKFTDYTKNDHGAYTIYFKNTLFSYFFGAAGVVIGTNETDTTPGKSESWFQRRTVTFLGKFPLNVWGGP